jgi:hypothetical protein
LKAAQEQDFVNEQNIISLQNELKMVYKKSIERKFIQSF